MTDVTQEMIEKGREAMRAKLNALYDPEQVAVLEAIYRAMKAVDPEYAELRRRLNATTYLPCEDGVYAISIGNPSFCLLGKDHDEAMSKERSAREFAASAARAFIERHSK